jgi:hypothetical protein
MVSVLRVEALDRIGRFEHYPRPYAGDAHIGRSLVTSVEIETKSEVQYEWCSRTEAGDDLSFR